MEIVRGLHNLRPEHRGCVATIGNFDGVHLGHQAVLASLQKSAAACGLPTTVITFEPQPLEFFAPERAPARLTRLREKCALFARCGIDRLLVLPFNAGLASLAAEDFVARVLVDGLAVAHLLVGDDFRFGRGRGGDFALLSRLGKAHGFTVENLPSRLHEDERISSTRIRDMLARGRLDDAAALLGRPYSMIGRVGHGDRRGRELGFPTLNLALRRIASPLAGVYAVRVAGLGGRALPGVANLGRRPTLDHKTETRLEVHLFDFERDVYGALVTVEFVDFLRVEVRFPSLDALRSQIADDAAKARALLLPDAVAG